MLQCIAFHQFASGSFVVMNSNNFVTIIFKNVIMNVLALVRQWRNRRWMHMTAT